MSRRAEKKIKRDQTKNTTKNRDVTLSVQKNDFKRGHTKNAHEKERGHAEGAKNKVTLEHTKKHLMKSNEVTLSIHKNEVTRE